MSSIGKRVIYRGPADYGDNKPLTVEGVAVAAVLPGTILKQTASGLDANDVASTVFGQQFIIADKDQMRSKSVDDAWTISENMVALRARPGENYNALVATAQTLIKGDALSRNGAGLLKKAVTDGTEEIVGYADEAITTSGTTLVSITV